ncbi:hypothetical protein JCM8547_000673 [Rhodosporidiobolus lusitaniae]
MIRQPLAAAAVGRRAASTSFTSISACTARRLVASPPSSTAAFSTGTRRTAVPFLPSRSTLTQPRRSFTSSPPSFAGPAAPRRADFKHLDHSDIAHFYSLLSSPSTSLFTTIPSLSGEWSTCTQEELVGYNRDWMDKYEGRSKVLLKPKSTEEVSAIVRYCYEKRIAIVPQGGNTGLVGGGVPNYDEVILSTAGLNQIREFDDVSGILTADAGCILESLSNHIGPQGYIMPLDLGAKGSCHIGGNVSTNAGGLRLLRYGSLHGSVLGIEAVLPDKEGTVLSLNMPGDGKAGPLRKDNTGYDLKQLFIGAEGTLGIVTGVSIFTPKLSTAVNVSLLSLPSFTSISTVYRDTRAHLGEILSAFEFFDQQGMDLVLEHTGVADPFAEDGEVGEREERFYVLIETSGSNKEHDDEKLSTLLEHLLTTSTITNGVLAQDTSQASSLWSLRESIAEACGKSGRVYKYDLSMKVRDMYSLVEEAREMFRGKGMLGKGKEVRTVVGYGHIGDGNLHINVVAADWNKDVEGALEPWIYEATAKRNGSISAEHGLGSMKASVVGYSKSDPAIAMMQQIRRLFDPRGILNPGKYLPLASELPVEAEGERVQ